MAKPKQFKYEDFHFRDVSKMFFSLDHESDRAVALIVSSWIDDALSEMIKGSLVQDNATVLNDTFQHTGPLGTFSSRIKLAYLIRRIGREVFENLETIRGIRNDFAHSREDLQFSDQSIKARCQNLFLEDFKRNQIGEFKPRNAFIATSIGILGFFIEFMYAPTMSTDGKDDYFHDFMKFMEQEGLENFERFADHDQPEDTQPR